MSLLQRYISLRSLWNKDVFVKTKCNFESNRNNYQAVESILPRWKVLAVLVGGYPFLSVLSLNYWLHIYPDCYSDLYSEFYWEIYSGIYSEIYSELFTVSVVYYSPLDRGLKSIIFLAGNQLYDWSCHRHGCCCGGPKKTIAIFTYKHSVFSLDMKTKVARHVPRIAFQ